MTASDYSFMIVFVCIFIILGVMRARNRQLYDRIVIRESRQRRIGYTIVEQPPEHDDDCCICLTRLSELDIEIADRIVKTDCNHYYHKFCLIRWINSDNELRLKCPLCLENL